MMTKNTNLKPGWRKVKFGDVVLVDFVIGSHADVLGVPLLTRDAQRFVATFPG